MRSSKRGEKEKTTVKNEVTRGMKKKKEMDEMKMKEEKKKQQERFR